MRISKLLAMLLGFGLVRSYVDDPEGGGGNVNPPANTPAPRELFSREYVSEVREEAKTWRLKAQGSEATIKEQAEKIAAAEAAANERVTAAEKAANDRVLRAELKAVAVKAGIVDMDALKLLDLSKVKLNEDGTIEGADALFEEAKKSKPYLFGEPSTSSTQKTPKPVTGEKVDVRKQTPEEYAASKAQYLADARKQ